MLTVRQVAACPLGFGLFPAGQPWSGAFSSAATFLLHAAPSVSLVARLREHVRRFVTLNAILVSTEMNPIFDLIEIQEALGIAAIIYGTVDIAVEGTLAGLISGSDAEDFEVIDSDPEANALAEAFTFPGQAIDVFFVREWVGPVAGLSPIGGPCSKADPDSGIVVDLSTVAKYTGITLAHEVGHYLGLMHEADPNNLMFKDVSQGSTKFLLPRQAADMINHCMMDWRCR
jgi:hypothetical protein